MEQRVQRAIDPIIQRIEEHVHPDDIVAELVTDGWTDREAKAMLLYLIDVSRGMSEVHSELVDGGVDPDRRMLSLVLWRLSPRDTRLERRSGCSGSLLGALFFALCCLAVGVSFFFSGL